MKEEIKEILYKLQKVANRETASRNSLMEMKDKDYQLLLDYISNLQEENERLKKNIYNAIEFIRNNIADIEFIKKQYNVVIFDDYVETSIKDIEKLINILQEDNIQENLYKYTPEKGFELVGDKNDKC